MNRGERSLTYIKLRNFFKKKKVALDAGAEWVGVSIFGLGERAINAQLE
jgi:hypothetical protein